MRVTVKKGKIVTIEALQLQGNDPRSVQLLVGGARSAAGGADPADRRGRRRQRRDVHERELHPVAQSALDKLGFKAPDGSVATLLVP